MMVIAPGTASACSCMIGSLAHQLAAADVVFIGTPTAGDEPQPVGGVRSSAAQVRSTFEVDVVHKGTVDRTVDVLSAMDSASCGVPFVVDRRYLVLALLEGDAVVAGLCGGSVRLDQVPADDLASLGSGAEPAANTQGTPAESLSEAAEVSNNSWSGPVVVLVTLALVGIVGFGLALMWRRSRLNP